MARLILGVTGSVAAIKTPELLQALRRAGHDVRIVATGPAIYFVRPDEIEAAIEGREGPTSRVLLTDEDEWPAPGYRRGDPVLHIELRKWADMLVVAPLDANTLAKLAVGLCDNCLTCVWRAWDLARPVVLAPAMNTLMWEHPFTRRHLRSLAGDAGAGHIPAHLTDELLIHQINDRSPTLHVVAPITKALACGDTGVGAMAEIEAIVAAVELMLNPRTHA